MIHLLIFHHYVSCVGAGLCLLHILQSLDREKFTATVYLPPIPGDLKPEIEKLGFPVKESAGVTGYLHYNGTRTSFLDPRHLSNMRKVAQSTPEIRRIITNEKPDLILVNSMTLCWIGKQAQACGVKAVCFDRETFRKGLLGVRTRWMKRCLRNDFDGVAFLSDFDMKQAGKGHGIFQRITDKVDVAMYDALDPEAQRRELQLPANKKLLLYMGGSHYLKGADVAVKALKYMHNPDVQLVYLQFDSQQTNGRKAKWKRCVKRILHRDYQHSIVEFAHKNRIYDRIIFRPATKEPERYVAACDIVLFPSRMVHQARPIYEAGIAGKPCVISDFPNTKEFADEKTAWLFPAGHPRALAKCVDQILQDPMGLATERVKENRARCEKNNALAAMQKELTAFLERVYSS